MKEAKQSVKEAKQPEQESAKKPATVFDKIELKPFPTKFETFIPKEQSNSITFMTFQGNVSREKCMHLKYL